MRKWTKVDRKQELERIKEFIRRYMYEDELIVVPVSGGLDSDVTARLCCKAIGNRRVKLFMVIEEEMENKFLDNARGLSADLKIPLKEIHLEGWNRNLMQKLEQAEGKELFNTDTLLDPGKAKCSVRSSVLSCYQDKGYIIAGTTNRTEKELGFFLTFGDNLAHIKPLAHLYKSELAEFAAMLGTSRAVIEQESSAGFWRGQTDREDLAYWILNDGPVVFPREFSALEVEAAQRIKEELYMEKIDMVLSFRQEGKAVKELAELSGLSKPIVIGLLHIVEKSMKLKNRKIMAQLET